MNEVSLNAQKRENAGKKGAKAARRNGLLPAIVYGGGHEPIPIALDYREFQAFARKHRGESLLINLVIDGAESKKALLREIQRDFVRNSLIHVDFQQVSLTDRISTTVPLVIVGTATGTRPEHGGLLEQSLRELAIECLASDIPEHLEADVTRLHLHESLHVGDLSFVGIKIVTDKDAVVASVVGIMTEKVAQTDDDKNEPDIVGRKAKEDA